MRDNSHRCVNMIALERCIGGLCLTRSAFFVCQVNRIVDGAMNVEEASRRDHLVEVQAVAVWPCRPKCASKVLSVQVKFIVDTYVPHISHYRPSHVQDLVTIFERLQVGLTYEGLN